MTAPRVDFCTWASTHHLVAAGSLVAMCNQSPLATQSNVYWNVEHIAVQDICRECLRAFADTVPAK